MSKIAVTSGCCNWTRCAWTMSPQNRIFFPFDENSYPVCPGVCPGSGTICMPSTIGSEPLNVCHLPALMYGAAMACALWERLRVLRRLSGDFRRQPKIVFWLGDVDLGIWKDALSVLSGQAADVIGMKVRDHNDVDFFRRVACAAEVARQVPEPSSSIPGAGARIDEDQMLASVDQVACIDGIQHVRIFVQCLYNTIDRRLGSVQPVGIEYAGTIE